MATNKSSTRVVNFVRLVFYYYYCTRSCDSGQPNPLQTPPSTETFAVTWPVVVYRQIYYSYTETPLVVTHKVTFCCVFETSKLLLRTVYTIGDKINCLCSLSVNPPMHNVQALCVWPKECLCVQCILKCNKNASS